MADEPEEWRNVVGYKGRYQVSSFGRVISLTRMDDTGRIRRGCMLRPSGGSAGYKYVALCKNGRCYHKAVHRLVLEAFVGPCPPGMECCHNNGIAGDNRIENLCWGTPSKNAADRVRHETAARGERQGLAKLTDEIVREIRASTESEVVLSKRYSVTSPAIGYARRGVTWKHVKEIKDNAAE